MTTRCSTIGWVLIKVREIYQGDPDACVSIRRLSPAHPTNPGWYEISW